MPDETEPTPAAPVAAEERAPDRTEENSTAPARNGVQVPKWLAVGAVAIALAGGGFAVGRTTASDNHGGFVPIGNNRPDGGPGGFGRTGGPDGGAGGEYGGGNGPGRGGDTNNNGGSNGSTTPSTTAGTGT